MSSDQKFRLISDPPKFAVGDKVEFGIFYGCNKHSCNCKDPCKCGDFSCICSITNTGTIIRLRNDRFERNYVSSYSYTVEFDDGSYDSYIKENSLRKIS